MSITVRFAPSPTGRLHAGNIRTALINALFAREQGGDFILRLDDTDRERSTEEFARGIEEDLAWLGLAWSARMRQSDRIALYEGAVEQLKALGRLYPAYETPEELDLKRKRQLARGKPPVYDRAALALSDAEKASFEAEGRTPHWRFLLEARDVVWWPVESWPGFWFLLLAIQFELLLLWPAVFLRLWRLPRAGW